MALDKLVDSAQLDSDLTSVANAIRTKGGTSAQLAFPQGFVDAVEAISAGGATIEDLANHSWPTGAVSIGLASIPNYALACRNGITSVTAPNATSVGEYSFYRMAALQSVSLPALTTIDKSGVFNGCSALRNIDLPELTTLNGSISNYQFAGVVGATMHFPKLKTISGNYAFRDVGASNNKCTIVLPKADSLAWHCFRGAYLNAVDLGPDLATLPAGCFYQGSGTSILILRKADGIVAASGTDTLAALPRGCVVYVPSDLISTYQSATNWSTKFSAGTISFSAIEGSIYETQYADGTPIT